MEARLLEIISGVIFRISQIAKHLFNCVPVLQITGSEPGGVLLTMDYTGRLRLKGVHFSGWRYIKG